MLAGATAVVCTYPLDLVRARFACQIFESKYDSLRHAIKTIFSRKAAFVAFIVVFIPTIGWSSTLCRYQLFFTYGLLRRLAERKGWTERNPTIVSLLCGACAGLVGQTFTFPLDVIRRRMQTLLMFRYNIEAEHAVAYLPKKRFWSYHSCLDSYYSP
ncbi:Graves disease carrier protein [Galdieria sulphuraria]|nr:Graves disease carrier protein [Galdieria sulphuraria]